MHVNSKERHRTGRIGWPRAAVLGANDGIVSTSSLVLGVAAAHATHSNVLVAGVAGLVAGAMSMAAGEYVSVHSQADTEQAELELERAEHKADDKGEHKELMEIYVACSFARETSRRPANGPRHDRRASPRRTRHLRDSPCASDSGCVGIGWQLRCWSRHASLGHCHGSGGGFESVRALRRVAGRF
jgi:VIT1/CCC1 family predicted Fe2+/Mn2+ transporter